MLIKKIELQKNIVENPKNGKGILNRWDYIKELILCGKTMTFSYIELESQSEIGIHPHMDNSEVYYFIDGEGTVSDNGEKKTVKAGDMLITQAGESHSLINTSTGNIELIAFILM
jgi:mannose-6-phosphate isomerase-like protein (cupin superfamily)